MNDVVLIKRVTHVRCLNKHNGYLFPSQDILVIRFRNGKERTLDLFSDKDATDVDYYEFIRTSKTKEHILFIDNDML